MTIMWWLDLRGINFCHHRHHHIYCYHHNHHHLHDHHHEHHHGQVCEDIDEEKCITIDVQECVTVTNNVRKPIILIIIIIIIMIIKINWSSSWSSWSIDHHMMMIRFAQMWRRPCAAQLQRQWPITPSRTGYLAMATLKTAIILMMTMMTTMTTMTTVTTMSTMSTMTMMTMIFYIFGRDCPVNVVPE